MKLALAALALLIAAAPIAAQDSITLANGQKVRGTDPSGGRGKVNGDGSVTYPDGTSVSVDSAGNSVIRRADGSRSVEPGPDTHTLPNGQEVRTTDPSGQRGKVYPDGSIGYPDGTRVRMGSDGSTEIVGPDGRVRSREAPPKGPAGEGGTPFDPGGSYTLSNGQRVRNTAPDGSMGTMMPDGSIRYADGTTVSVGPDGSTIITRPDGSRTTEPPPGEEGSAEDRPGSESVEDAIATAERLKARGMEIVRLEMQADNCPKGSGGKACRTALRERIKALQAANKEDAAAMGERLSPTMR